MIEEITKETNKITMCPFWVKIDKKSLKIRCSHIESNHRKANEYLDLQFQSKQDKREQILKYCATYNYLKCPTYKKLISRMEKK